MGTSTNGYSGVVPQVSNRIGSGKIPQKTAFAVCSAVATLAVRTPYPSAHCEIRFDKHSPQDESRIEHEVI